MGRTPLHDAAALGDLTEVCRMLDDGLNVNATDHAGWTPLHFAAQAQAPDVVAHLLAAGACTDSADEHGNTPLWRATFSYNGDPETLRVLLAAGADPDRTNAHDLSPRALANRIARTDVARHMPSPSSHSNVAG